MRQRVSSSGSVPSPLEALDHKLMCIAAKAASLPEPVAPWDQPLSVSTAPSMETRQASEDWNEPETPSVRKGRSTENGAPKPGMRQKKPSRLPHAAATANTHRSPPIRPSAPVQQRGGSETVFATLSYPARIDSVSTDFCLASPRMSVSSEPRLVADKKMAIDRLLTSAGMPTQERGPDNSPEKVCEAYGELRGLDGTDGATNARYRLGALFQLRGGVSVAYQISDKVAPVLAACTEEDLRTAEQLARTFLESIVRPDNEAFYRQRALPPNKKSPAR